jgi:hypothetical protein
VDSPAGWEAELRRIGEEGAALAVPGLRPERWPRIYRTSILFIREHGARAAEQGWTGVELFGVHPLVGLNRVDCCGALMLCRGSPVVSVAQDAIGYANGLTFHRSPRSGPSVPIWLLR